MIMIYSLFPGTMIYYCFGRKKTSDSDFIGKAAVWGKNVA